MLLVNQDYYSMVIKNNLNNLVNARKDIIKAINDKGVSCPTTTKLAQIPPYIKSIKSDSGGQGSTLQEIYDNTSTQYYLTWAGSPSNNIYKEVSFKDDASVIFVIFKNEVKNLAINVGGTHFGYTITNGTYYYQSNKAYDLDYVHRRNISARRNIILMIEPHQINLNDRQWTPSTIFLIPTFVKYNNYKVWFPTNELNRELIISQDSVFVYGLSTGSTKINSSTHKPDSSSFESTFLKIYDENKNLILDVSTNWKEVKTGKIIVKKGYSVIGYDTLKGYSRAFGICYW